jgi:hypothetical protein
MLKPGVSNYSHVSLRRKVEVCFSVGSNLKVFAKNYSSQGRRGLNE